MNKYILSLGLRAPVAQLRRGRFTHWNRWHVVIIGFGVALVALYMFLVNSTAAQGFRMRELEKYIETIRTESQTLELQVAQLRSMQSLDARLAGQGFVPVTRIDYLTPGVPAVALR
ncbi:hypothetical protein HY478_02875 [Candidatus Uhrbacteria bacterium]|nr:hypothetical protein [Candidatus Uhrbacteria bacterium]